MSEISRRQLLALATAAPAALWLGATSAEAASPIILRDTTVRRYGPVALIGDSTSGGYVGGLKKELVSRKVGPFRCDILGARSIARASSSYPSGVAAVKSARAAGFKPKAWVIALGTNDQWFVGQKPSTAKTLIDTLMREIGTSRRVYFLNLYETKKGSWSIVNSALASATGRWGNLRIVDWASLAKQHKAWHGPDGTHYTSAGASARNAFLAQTMVRAASG